jgi:hypothetical protein
MKQPTPSEYLQYVENIKQLVIQRELDALNLLCSEQVSTLGMMPHLHVELLKLILDITTIRKIEHKGVSDIISENLTRFACWYASHWQPTVNQFPELKDNWLNLSQKIDLYQFKAAEDFLVQFNLHKEEQKARRDAEARAKNEAEQRAKREAEDRAEREKVARIEVEARAKREAEEKARRDAEARAKNEAEQRAKREAEEKAQREAAARAKREAEEKAQREAAARAKREAEEKAQRELEKKLEPYWSGFQKIGRNGEVLPLTAPQWAAVKHLKTGLIWATNWAKDDDFPVTSRLQWYRSYGYFGDGYVNDGKNTESHIQRVNQQRWCGQQDWYLPSKEELESLANALQLNGNYSLERYKAIFPNDEAYHFWSASTVAGPLSNAWLVNFDDGYTSDFIKDVSGHVRAVRVGQ